MIRTLLAAYLTFATAAGPWLCCCIVACCRDQAACCVEHPQARTGCSRARSCCHATSCCAPAAPEPKKPAPCTSCYLDRPVAALTSSGKVLADELELLGVADELAAGSLWSQDSPAFSVAEVVSTGSFALNVRDRLSLL